MNFLDFLAWEEKTRDTVDFKTAYVDMTAFTEEDVALLGGDNRSKVERGDLVSGLLLSQIVYWLRVRVGGQGLYRHRERSGVCRDSAGADCLLENPGTTRTTYLGL